MSGLEQEILAVFRKAEKPHLSRREVKERLAERGSSAHPADTDAALDSLAWRGLLTRGRQHRYPTLSLSWEGRQEGDDAGTG